MAFGSLWDVKIQNFDFNPLHLNVQQGDTVRWTNLDEAHHNVDILGVFVGPILMQNETFEWTFDDVGSFDYLCDPHPWMTGNVTVVPEPSAILFCLGGLAFFIRRSQASRR